MNSYIKGNCLKTACMLCSLALFCTDLHQLLTDIWKEMSLNSWCCAPTCQPLMTPPRHVCWYPIRYLRGCSKRGRERERNWEKQINIQLKSMLNLWVPWRRQRSCSRERWLPDYYCLNGKEMDSQAERKTPYSGALSYWQINLGSLQHCNLVPCYIVITSTLINYKRDGVTPGFK